MVEPTVIPRSEHPLSRRDVDADALKVLYRLKEAGFIAYLVGGGVRDLLLGRRPKDFDIGTSAHPYQVKRLFRNCWVIGRRFRLVHVKFGQKIIEVATFRRHVPPGGSGRAIRRRPKLPGQSFGSTDAQRESAARDLLDPARQHVRHAGRGRVPPRLHDQRALLRYRDLLHYRLRGRACATCSDRVIRAIGDPDERFLEDPVRMLRAVAFAERLGFTLDPPVEAAIRAEPRARSRAARRARLIEEYYKILRTGASAAVFRTASRLGLLEAVTPELQRAAGGDALWQSLERLDAYRGAFAGVARDVHQPGPARQPARAARRSRSRTDTRGASRTARGWARCRSRGATSSASTRSSRCSGGCATRTSRSRSARALMARGAFADALAWLEIHGDAPDAVGRWGALVAELTENGTLPELPASMPAKRRRRRRGPRPAGRDLASVRLRRCAASVNRCRLPLHTREFGCITFRSLDLGGAAGV